MPVTVAVAIAIERGTRQLSPSQGHSSVVYDCRAADPFFHRWREADRLGALLPSLELVVEAGTEGLRQPAIANQRSLLDPTRKKPALEGGRDALDKGGVGAGAGAGLDRRDTLRPRSESSPIGGDAKGGVSSSGDETKRSRIGAVGDVGVDGTGSSVGFGTATYSIVASESSRTSVLA